MNLDDEVCLCFHVSRRKLVNWAARNRPKVPSQMSLCAGAGTGCGWCVPFLKQIFRQSSQATEGGEPGDIDQLTPEEYAARRAEHIKAGKGTSPAVAGDDGSVYNPPRDHGGRMSPADILKFTRKKPFEPFRIMVMDGTSYDIHHPEFCMVLMTSVIVGVSPNEGLKIPGTAEWIDARYIHKLIPLGDATATTGPAQQNGIPGP